MTTAAFDEKIRYAHAICNALKRTVFFQMDTIRRGSEIAYAFRVYRRGMGKIADVGSVDALISLLRKQMPRQLKKNPAPRSLAREKEQAAALFEDFTGHAADEYQQVDLPRPKVALAFGKLLAVEYETVRDGKVERYRHAFKKESRPTLAAAHDGSSLAIVGGRYNFTERGITDY